MDIRPIRTEADYKVTLKEISALMDSDPDLGIPADVLIAATAAR